MAEREETRSTKRRSPNYPRIRTLGAFALVACCITGCAGLIGGTGNAQPNAAAVKASIPVKAGTILLAMGAGGSHLYAAANNGLHVIDTASNQIVATLDTPPNPAGLVATASRGFLTNLFSLRLSVFDTEAQALLDSIALFSAGTRPAYGRVAVSNDGAMVYIVDQVGSNLIAVGSAGAPAPQAFQLDLKPSDVTIAPDGRWAYICGCKGFCTPGRVQRFDTRSNTFGESFEVGPNPYRVAVHPNGETLYTANLGDGSISVVDIGSLSLKANIQVAPQLTAIAISNDGEWVYTVSRAANQLAVVEADGTEVHTSMNIGPEPREVVLSPDGRRAYVSTSGAVVVVDTATFLDG